MFKYVILLLSLLLGTSALASNNGKVLMESMCTSCHVTSGQGVIAPPIFAVKNHVKNAYPAREDFIQQIVDWVEEPNQDVSLMPGAINKFGLMPKLGYSQQDVEKIASYLYDEDLKSPRWYQKHYQEHHGTNTGY